MDIAAPRINEAIQTWQGWALYENEVRWVRPTPGWRPSAENTRAAYEVLDQIEEHPESWNQGVWWCGTGGCFAGWRCALSGETFADTHDTGEPISMMYRTASGLEIADRAAQLLGFPSADALDDYAIEVNDYTAPQILFSAGNDQDDLAAIVLAVFGPRPAGM